MKRCITAIAAGVLSILALNTASASLTTSSTDSFSDFTDLVNQPLTVAQFDTQGGTRTLLSVQIVADCWISSSLSGSVKNNSSTASAYYSANVDNASTSLAGPGLSSPLAGSANTLLTYGPVTIAPRTTLTIPLTTQELHPTTSVLLVAGTDNVNSFVGSGNLTYLLNASADSRDSLTGSANVQNQISFATMGGGGVTITYTYEPVPVPEASTLVSAALCGLMLLVGTKRRTSGLSRKEA